MKLRTGLLITLILAATVFAGQTYIYPVQPCGMVPSIAPANVGAAVDSWRQQGCTDVHLRYDAASQKWLGYAAKIATTIPKNIVVSNAGSSVVNETYSYRGLYDGKPYYNVIGQPDDPFSSSIFWLVNEWEITGPGGGVYYLSGDAVDRPSQVSSWVVDGGNKPAPTVTEIP